jgi:hypothetical protein
MCAPVARTSRASACDRKFRPASTSMPGPNDGRLHLHQDAPQRGLRRPPRRLHSAVHTRRQHSRALSYTCPAQRHHGGRSRRTRRNSPCSWARPSCDRDRLRRPHWPQARERRKTLTPPRDHRRPPAPRPAQNYLDRYETLCTARRRIRHAVTQWKERAVPGPPDRPAETPQPSGSAVVNWAARACAWIRGLQSGPASSRA